MQAVTTVGLDIAKSVFQVHGVDAEGNVLIRRQPSAATSWRSSRSCRHALVGIEACATSHHPRFRPTKNDRRLLRRRRYVLDGCGGRIYSRTYHEGAQEARLRLACKNDPT